MTIRSILSLASIPLIAVAMPCAAQSITTHIASSDSPSDLVRDERDALIAKLKDAQVQLKNGKKPTFELTSGGPAYYDVTTVPPRRAFIDVDFSGPYSAKMISSLGTWKHYELIYFPPGPKSLMWKVDIFVNQFEPHDLERVAMVYTAPPPF